MARSATAPDHATAPTRLRPPSGPPADEAGTRAPAAEELAARRLLKLHGPGLLDGYRKKVAALEDSARRHLGYSDPYDRFDGVAGWLAGERPGIRLRHALASRLAQLEALGGGGEWVPTDDARIDRATARDLLRRFIRGTGRDPLAALLAAASARIQAVGRRLAQAQESLGDESLSYWCTAAPDPAILDRLTEAHRRESDAAARFARLRAVRDRLVPALAGHVAAAVEAAGGDDAVCAGLAAAMPKPAPAPIEDDREVRALAEELAGANRNIDALLEVAARNGKCGAAIAELRDGLGDTESRLSARRRHLQGEHDSHRLSATAGFAEIVAAARAGDAASWWTVARAAREHPDAFPAGFAGSMLEALLSALADAGPVEFAEALAPPADD